MDDDTYFDFGFTAADEEELTSNAINEIEEENDEIELQLEKSKAQVADLQIRIEKLFKAIQPLLQNLKANPEKDYIHWPNRTAKIDSFNQTLESIYNGNEQL